MQKVSKTQQKVLQAIDEEIERLERILAKAQPYIDELNRLKKTRGTLLNERTTTGGINGKARLTMNEVIHAFRELGGNASSQAVADKLSVDVTVVRSHLNRHKDERYERESDGTWSLIGKED